MASRDGEDSKAGSQENQPPYPVVLERLGVDLDMDMLRMFQLRLEKELASGNKETTAMIRISHWLSFISWHLGEKKLALEYNEKTSLQPTDNLPQEYQNMDIELIIYDAALKEIALFYGSLGPRYYKKSIELYEAIIKNHPVNDNPKWRCCLGLAHRWYLKNRAKHRTNDQYVDRIAKASREFCSVIAKQNGNEFYAKAWVNLADLAGLLKKYELPLSALPDEVRQFSQTDMLEKASSLAKTNKDGTTLGNCGKIYLFLKKYDKAEEILKSALEIKETSAVHQNLAVTLKSQIAHGYGTVSQSRPTQFLVEKTAAIEYHFKKAIDLGETNAVARIELGLYLKDNNRVEEAIEYFTGALGVDTCPIDRVTQCYEEMSICFKQRAKVQKTRTDKRADEHRSKLLLLVALETRSEILLKRKENSIPGLSAGRLLTGKPQPTSIYINSSLEKAIQYLQGFVQRHSGDIEKVSALYRTLLAPRDGSSENSDVLLSMAVKYLDANDFSSAIILLNLMQLSQKDKTIQQLNFKAHVEGALQEETMDIRLAHDRFRNSFPLEKLTTLAKYSNDETFHVLLLSKTNTKSSSLAGDIARILRKQCGLDVSVNTEFPVFNTISLGVFMRRSFCTAIVEDGNAEEDGSFLYTKLDAIKMKQDHPDTHVIIINVDVTNLQTDLRALPMTDRFPVGKKNTSDVMVAWLRSFFQTAVGAYLGCVL